MFDLFVSYAHEDVGLASALTSGLGRIGKPWWRRRSLRVARSAAAPATAASAAEADSWDSTRARLEASRWFVAVVSPAAAASPSVAREIAWWVENRGSEQLLVVVAAGTSDWDPGGEDWAAGATALPLPLRGAFDGEPRWVDATWTAGQTTLGRRDGRLVDLLAEIAAPVQGTTKDALVGEELRQHRRTVRTTVGAAVLLFVLTIASVVGAFVALDERDKAEGRRQEALSQSLAGQATEVGSRRPDLGVRLAVEAWRHAHTSQAEQALINAVQLTLPAAERFRAPDNGSLVYELIAFPEHGYALAGRADGSLTLWKLPANGDRPDVPKPPESPHQASITAFARDASGARLVSVDGAGLVAVWDAATLAKPRTFSLPKDTGLVSDADLTADGTLLMLSTPAGVQLWDVDQEVQLQIPSSPLAVADATISYAAMSPDGAQVGATIDNADGNVTIRIWDVVQGTSVTQALGGSDTFVDVSFSNDGLYFATLDVFGELAAYRASDGVNVALLTPDDVATTLTGGPLGGMVPVQDHSFIAANGSATALYWNAATGQVLGRYALALGGSPSAVTGSGNAFVASDVAGTLTWVSFGPASSANLATSAGTLPAGSRFGISAAPDLLLAVAGNTFTVWNAEQQRAERSFSVLRADQAVPVYSALDRAGRRVALGYEDGTVEVYDAETGHVTVAEPQLVTGIAQVSFAGDALVVATYPTAEPAEVVVVARDGAVRRLWRAPAHRRINAFATSGESVAIGLDTGELLVWDSPQSDEHRDLDLGALPAWRIAFSASGRRLVVGDGGGRLHVVDRTGTQLRQLRDPITTDHGPVLQLGFSSDDRVVAVSPILVSYVDTATGTTLASNVLLTQWSSLVTVPDGLVTVDSSGALLRWRLDPEFLLSKLCPELKTEHATGELQTYLDGGTASSTCPGAS